jgi:hypothetical protein
MPEGARSDLRTLALALVAGVIAIGLVLYFGIPAVREALAALEPGVGLKTAAIWSFGVTVVLFIVFALVAGDGLVGELTIMLTSFFFFFALITLLIAWVF